MVKKEYNRKGQITIFIIIGVILLFSSAVVFFIKNQISEQGFSAGEEPKIAKVPGELEPVKKYVESCIKKIAIESLTQIGEKGGYVDLDSQYLKDNGFSFKEKPNKPTESDFIRFGGFSSDWKIPYWNYMSTKNDLSEGCRFSTKQPPLKRFSQVKRGADVIAGEVSIEQQLDGYMDQNLPLCVGEFDELTKQGFKIKTGNVRTQTTVADDDVWFLVEYPLSIDTSGIISEIKQFFVKVNVPLKDVYSLANEITNIEANKSFLARNLIALINIYSGIGGNNQGKQLLPPMSGGGVDFSGGEMWTRTNVKENLQTMLNSWIGAFQVEGSRNYIPLESDPVFKVKRTITQLYRNMAIPIFSDASDYNIKFEYLSMFWPIYFDVNSDGEVIKADSIAGGILPIPIGIQQYNTVYDVSYPVKIEIRGKSTPEFKDGYAFVFALEGNVRANEPFKCGNSVIEVENTNRIGGTTMMCNPNQRTSGNVTITVIDMDANPVNGVNVVQEIGGTSCVLGATLNGVFVTKMSPGYGMTLNFVSPNHLKKAVAFDIDQGQELILDPVVLDEFKDVKVDVKKIELNSLLQPQSIGSKLNKKDQVVIVFTRLKNSPFEEDFSAVAEFKEGVVQEPIRLTAGDYEVSAQLIVGKSAFIPEEEREAGSWPFEEEYTIPSITLPDPHPWGGLEFDKLTISENSLEDGKLEMKVLEFPEPSRVEDLELVNQISSLSSTYKLLMIPR